MNYSEPNTSVGNPNGESIRISKGDKVFWGSVSGIRHFSHDAMATIFEIFIQHPDARYAGQAARAAFDELDRLEAELSRFIENSDISRINNLTADQPMRIGPAAFECLQICADLYARTDGAFDITIGALMDCWFGRDKAIRCPSKDELELARRCTGMHLITLDQQEHTVTKHKLGTGLSSSGAALTRSVQIDLGGFGKGYTVDQMTKLLGDWSIDTALVHGGCSSVLAVGAPTTTQGWPVTLSNPSNHSQTLARLYLQNRAISGSSLQQGRHIINPRTGQPVHNILAAWACTDNAAVADALSTAFMVMSPDEVRQYCLKHPDTMAMLVTDGSGAEVKSSILHFGPWKEAELVK
jgi:thiamine biosynthesis lipoprotein